MTNIYQMGQDTPQSTLPPWQKLIKTKSLVITQQFFKLVVASKSGYPVIAVNTGKPGVGKTITVNDFVMKQKHLPGTGLPGIIKNEIKPSPQPKGLAMDLARSLQDEIKGRTIYEIADECTDAILRNHVQLLIFDEADRLNEKSFELIRHIFDRSGCPVVLVGLPQIWSVINRHEKFKSRVGLKARYEPITKKEMIHSILPDMAFEYWRFDPKKNDDLELGEYIWGLTGSSLRKLRNLLQNANNIAKLMGDFDHVTQEILEAARHFTPLDDAEDVRTDTETDDIVQDGDSEGLFDSGDDIDYEKESEDRKKAKEEKSNGKNKK